MEVEKKKMLTLEEEGEGKEKMLTLALDCGTKFQVQRSHAKISDFLRVALGADRQVESITVSGVGPPEMKRIVAFMEHHKGKDIKPLVKPLVSSSTLEGASQWDQEFVRGVREEGTAADRPEEQGLPELHLLISAADRMAINGLVHLLAAEIARPNVGKSFEDYKKWSEGHLGGSIAGDEEKEEMDDGKGQ